MKEYVKQLMKIVGVSEEEMDSFYMGKGKVIKPRKLN